MPSRQPGRTTARSAHKSFKRCAIAAKREPSKRTTAPGPHRGQLGRVPRGDGVDQPRGEPPEDLGKEGRAQIATPLEEGFGRGLDPGEQGVPLVARVGQGLAQRLGSAQNDRRPEHQRVQCPRPLPLRPTHAAERRLTQGRGDVGLPQIDQPQQVDLAGCPPFGHSTPLSMVALWRSRLETLVFYRQIILAAMCLRHSRRACRGRRLRVIRAADGQGVLEQLQRHEVDLLVLDINMPHLGGASLVQLLRGDPEWERFAALPIIIVSGMWDVVTFDLNVQAGFAKPIPLPDLRAKVRELIGAPR
jgi:CheY-like chemotaxis protein